MNHAAEFYRCLLELDAVGVRRLWSHVAPNQPQPRNNGEARATLHHARTAAESIPERLRCYSHSWLLERNLPSSLPDRLKPKADRLYPRRVEAVGVAVLALSADNRDRARAIEAAMSKAVMECYAEGERDPDTIKARMAAARRAVG